PRGDRPKIATGSKLHPWGPNGFTIFCPPAQLLVFLYKVFNMKEYNITIVTTNDPKIIKLEANHFLVKGNYEYKNIDQAKDSPLAQQLFYLPFIKTVYIASNFVALERYDIVDWKD